LSIISINEGKKIGRGMVLPKTKSPSLFFFFSSLFSLLSQERERRGTHSVVAKTVYRTVYRTVDSSVHRYPYCYNFQTNKFP